MIASREIGRTRDFFIPEGIIRAAKNLVFVLERYG
jgi:hypothetical protein